MAIDFTQYMRPNGRKVPQWIERPDDIEEKAKAVIAAGGRFEVEHLMSGAASLTVAYQDDDIAIRVVQNGPPVLEAVDAIVEEAYEILVKGQDPSS
jgi:hypothetical protein